MNRVLRVSAEDLDATVEAGVTRKQLNAALRNTGLMFPIDPGADATIGGMAATRASGTTAVRYGTMRENVLGLTVVLADGRVIRTGTRARKSSAGYDLTRLFVGSEGTLGVITEVTLRLHPLPEAVAAAVCSFDSMRGAVDTVIATIQLGIPVARIELLDEVQHRRRQPLLEDGVSRSRRRCSSSSTATASAHVAEQARSRAGDRRRARRPRVSSGRRARRTASGCGRRGTTRLRGAGAAAGARAWTTDVCVPISRLADCIVETQGGSCRTRRFRCAWSATPATATSTSIYLIDPASDGRARARRSRLNDRLVERALAMGGTCTGEHGVGFGKMKSLEAEHGDGARA